jgi:4-hydroxy-4-methyl-2-oxoglutarate aldolase
MVKVGRTFQEALGVEPVAGDENTGDHTPAQIGDPPARRLDDGLLRRLAALPGLTATASDVLDGMGCALVVPGDDLVPRVNGGVVAGHAITLRYLPERPIEPRGELTRASSRLAHRVAFAACAPGDVLVVDAAGTKGISTFGGMAALRARELGIAGLVVDGAIRDLDEIRAVGLPAWSRSITPRTGKWRLEAVGVNVPVCCGGYQVVSGDLVLADASGVCFIPIELADQAVEEILEVAGREAAQLRGKVAQVDHNR